MQLHNDSLLITCNISTLRMQISADIADFPPCSTPGVKNDMQIRFVLSLNAGGIKMYSKYLTANLPGVILMQVIKMSLLSVCLRCQD